MTMIKANAQSRKIGCFGAIIISGWALIVVITSIRGCARPYWQGRKIIEADPCHAAGLFGEDIRQDTKGSVDSVIELSKMNNSCSLKEMICLMDIPDGHHGEEYRQMIAEIISKRTAGSNPPPPFYDPHSSTAARVAQKEKWLTWYENVYLVGAKTSELKFAK